MVFINNNKKNSFILTIQIDTNFRRRRVVDVMFKITFSGYALISVRRIDTVSTVIAS